MTTSNLAATIQASCLINKYPQDFKPSVPSNILSKKIQDKMLMKNHNDYVQGILNAMQEIFSNSGSGLTPLNGESN